jgi:Right handed beta helix region
MVAATYYVAPNGSDAAGVPGSEAAPFASWARAQSAAGPGDTVYFRGGVYRYKDATSVCSSGTATVNAVVLNKSGTAGSPIRYWAYPGETPVFDFSGINDTSKYSCRQVGVRVQADWLYLKGLELTGTLQLNSLNHESWCVYVTGGSNNVFEQLDAHHNMGPGFFIQEGGNNTFLNCDSHENEDSLTSNGDGQSADGFGCHPDRASDTGNVFRGCRAWWNSDDGWDFINSQAACTVEYSWAWYNGYKPDAVSGGGPVSLSAGNGNGFKGGGYGDPQTKVPAAPPQHTIRFDCAFYNKANGLYANHEIVSPYFYDNTSFNNGTDVDMLGLDGTTVTSVGTLRNNLAYSNNGHGLLADMTNGGPLSDEYNSWDTTLHLTVADADFQSVAFAPPASCPAIYAAGGTRCCGPTDSTCFAGMAGARGADGSLPTRPFLRLAAGSPLVDKGTDVGLPFSGKAPDLGCFEVGLVFDPSDGGTSSGAAGDGATPVVGDGGSGGGTSSGGSSSGGGTASSAAADANGSASGSGTPGQGPGAGEGDGARGEATGGCSCRVQRASADSSSWGSTLVLAIAVMVAARRRA